MSGGNHPRTGSRGGVSKRTSKGLAIAMLCALAAATVSGTRQAVADSGPHSHSSYLFMSCDPGRGDHVIFVSEGEDYSVAGGGNGPHAGIFRDEDTSVWFFTYEHEDAPNPASTDDYTELNGEEKSFRTEADAVTNTFSFSFSTKEDRIAEGDETFRIRMSRNDNSYGTSRCTVKILDNEITVERVRIISRPSEAGAYRAGENVEIEVEFSDDVVVQRSETEPLPLWFDGTGTAVYRGATFNRMDGRTKAIFRYVVQDGDLDFDGLTLGATTADELGEDAFLAFHEGDREGRAVIHTYARQGNLVHHKVDARRRVADVSIASTPSVGRAYRTGESILVDVTFDGEVDVTGSPVVSLWFDGGGTSVFRGAQYLSGSGTTTLRFRYLVKDGDRDVDGVTIGAKTADGLGANTIKVAGTQTNAVHSYSARRNLGDHRVSTEAPMFYGSHFNVYTGNLWWRTDHGRVVRLEPSMAQHLRPAGDSDTYVWSIENLSSNTGRSGTPKYSYSPHGCSGDRCPDGVFTIDNDGYISTKEGKAFNLSRYRVKVTVVDRVGGGDFAYVNIYAAAQPRAPRNLSASVGADSRVRLSWDPPAHENREAPVTGYHIQWFPSVDQSNFLNVLVEDTGTTETSYTHRLTWNAPVGRIIGYRVRAINRAGKGTSSPLLRVPDDIDTAGPRVREAVLKSDGRTLEVTFDESVDKADLPGRGAFTVTENGEEVALSGSVRRTGNRNRIGLQLAAAAARGRTVSLSYDAPTSGGALQDAVGNRTASFSGFPVANRSGVDPKRPQLDTAEVSESGEDIVLTFDEALDARAGRGPPASAFAVELRARRGTSAGEQAVRVGTVTVAGREVRLSGLVPGIRASTGTVTRAVFVTYTDPSSADDTAAIQTTAGDDARSFAEFATNSSTLDASDGGVGPGVLFAAVEHDGASATLFFDEAIDGNALPGPGAWTLLADGTAVGVGTVDRDSFVLTTAILRGLRPTVRQGQTVTLSYTRPTSGNVLEDTSGNDAESFANLRIRNNSTVTGLAVADAQGTEGTDSAIAFDVTLLPAAASQVTVDYATSDGTATAPSDYISTSGSLTFAPGETRKTVSVPIVDDSVEDDAETFTLTLSNPSGSVIVHGTATGTIRNSEASQESRADDTNALTAEFREAPEDGHGVAAFTLELRFSEEFPLSYLTLRDHAIDVAGGTLAGLARATPGKNRTWNLTFAPQSGAGDVTVTLPARACGETGAVCTSDGRGLAADVTATVPAAVTAETPFRVRLEGVPAEHDGSGEFSLRVVFNKKPNLVYTYTRFRDETLRVVRGGTALAPTVRRLNPPYNDRWAVTVSPGGNADVTVSVGPFSACSDTGAVCTSGGEVLSNAVAATIQGPPGLSVADARAYEAEGATVDFAVTLGRASQHTVTVDYATSDGTAEAGSDYEAASGTLTFAPGETSKTVPVAVLNDAHDEGEETFALTLSNPSGGNAYLADATATGTIENTDAMPQAWLARFGRTVAEQAIEAVEGRLAASRRPGVEATLAGERIGASGAAPEDPEARAQAAEEREARSRLEAMTRWLRGEERDGDGARPDSRSVTERDLLLGSSFSLTGAAKAGGLVSLWGRGAVSRFDGREGDLSLSGEVTSVMLGTDWTRGPGSGAGPGGGEASGAGAWTAGLLLSRSEGAGSYRGEGEGQVSSTLTALWPYGRYEATDRVTLWGMAGYGAGDLVLTPEGQSAMRADMDLAMGAVGLRGVALEAPAEGGVELAVKSDAMAVRTSSEKAAGLEAAAATVTRLRLGLEGTWRGLEAGGGALAPRLEVGVRHDGGDAETGFGLDLGGGLAWSHPAAGLTAEFSGRGLLTHESKGFRDRGLSGSFAWDPGQGWGRGPKLTLTQALGGPASGGADALLGQRHLEGLAANDNGSGADDLANRRLDLRMGYGFSALEDRFTSTPELGLGLSNGAREYTLGWRLNRRGGPGALELRVEGTRREASGANDNAAPEHGVGFGLTARW